jgi:thermitase
MRLVYRTFTAAIVLAVLLSCLSFGSSVSADNGGGGNVAPDRLLVKFKANTYANTMVEVHRQVGGTFAGIVLGIGVQEVTVPHGQGAAKLAAYRSSQNVAWAELDSVAHILDVPDDTYFNLQWGMADVQAPQAWDITHGSSGVSIAILDTGIDLSHPDLASKIISSINFTTSPTAAANGESHGTHVAGIAAALTNNGIGVAGLGRDCSLMNVKVLGDDGYGYYSWIAQGITWAADNGADVINLSLGGSTPSSTLQDAIDYAWGKGVVVVAAAGNNGSTSPFYPAYYTNCLSVAATNASDQLASFSDHGSWVDVAAPGTDIYSTVPGGQYGYLSGTSMASPEVAGLAGLLFSVTSDTNGNGKLNDEVVARIEANCDNVGIDVAFGRINAYKAVQGVSTLPPTPPPSPTVPAAPALLSPSNGAVVPGTSITYKWSASAGATNYYLVVSTSSNPSDTSKYKYNGFLGAVTQYTNTGYPNNGATYYWWVSAGNSLGWASNADVLANGCSFVNGSAPAPTPSPTPTPVPTPTPSPAVPSAPTLLSPGNGAVVPGTSITYKWSASAGATNYFLVVSTSSDSSDRSKYKYCGFLGNVLQYTNTGYPNNGATYYWWVSAGNALGWSSASQVASNGSSFVNGSAPAPTPSPTPTPVPTPTPAPAVPAAPTLLSPGNGTVASGTSITYKWSASAGATNYFLVVSTSSDSSDRSKYKYCGFLGNVLQYTNTGYANNGATYYWWVSAGNSLGWSSQSQVAANGSSFVNGSAPAPTPSPTPTPVPTPTPTPAVPSAPTLLSPGNGAVVPGTSITYKWSASAGATNYFLVVSTSSDSSDRSKYKYCGFLGNVLQYTNTGYPNNGATYYWWVSAGNSLGWSSASQVAANGGYSFVNGSAPAPTPSPTPTPVPTPTPTPAVPSGPTLLSPSNGAVVSGTSITYKWSASAGATNYFLVVSTSSNPSDTSKYKVSALLGNVVQYTDAGYLNNGTTYYWWVSAGNSLGWATQSGVQANGCSFIN